MHHRARFARIVTLSLLAGVCTVPFAGTAAEAKSATPTYVGPDVSSYQHPATSTYPHGRPINWKSVAGAGKAFAIVKATEGTTYLNPFFTKDYAGALAAGLVHGSYHFARPGLPITSTADAQAEYFAKTIGAVDTTQTLPPALDLEVSGGLSRAQLVTWAQVFLYRLRTLTGRTPMLYTYPYFWANNLGDATAFSRFPLWMAAYGTSKAPVADLWQYTDSAKIPGISGGVDQSRYLTTSDLPWTELSDGTQTVPWATAAPNPPHALSVVPGPETATVSWLPGSDGSARTTSYTVVATAVGDPTPSGQTATVSGTTTGATVTGLDPTQTYTFTVTATSSAGTSKPSAPSKAIAPVVDTAISPTVPRAVTIGKPATVSGLLTRTDTGAVVPGKRITVYREPSGATTWTEVGTVTTGTTGGASMTLHPSRSVVYKLVFHRTAGYLSSSTITKAVVVRPVVTATLSASTVVHDRKVTLNGTVTPALAGQTVTKEVLIKGVWTARGTTTTSESGAYTFTVRPTHKQKDRELRVVAAPTKVRGTGYSPVVHLTVT